MIRFAVKWIPSTCTRIFRCTTRSPTIRDRSVVQEIQDDKRVRIARNPNDVDSFVQTGQKFIFHTLDGGFSLQGNPDNVNALADLGIAMITPAHLFYRTVSTCENGLPPLVYTTFHKELDSQPCFGLSPAWPQGYRGMFSARRDRRYHACPH
jgi:hypothetical protein